MSHPDEGTIQMLLDGELDAVERRRVERHVAECAACAAKLAEAREFLQEADRLVEVLAVPERAAQPLVAPNRRTLVRTLAWAASIVIAVGVGYWGRGPTPLTTSAPILQDEETGPRPAALPPPATAPPQDEPMKSAVADAGARRDTDAGKRAGEAKDADRASANEPAPKAVGASPTSPTITARAERAAQSAALAAPVAQAANEAIGRWRVISMEEAVSLLGGQLRLIDGLTPDRVETGPGTAVAGAEPGLPLVRVVYAGGTVILDQQRPMIVAEARQADAAKAVGGVTAESSATAWQQRGEIRFVVTGSVSTDSLRALAERVR